MSLLCAEVVCHIQDGVVRVQTDHVTVIEEHQTDFIRFKSALLSKDAGDDPYKRAELIKDITSSIAVIPDMITRQVYIKDSAERLHMSEKVLTTEVVKLRKQKIEEADKSAERAESQATSTPTPSVSPQDGLSEKRPGSETVGQRSGLEANYYNLMQLIVRYGERPIEVDGTIYTIGDVIIDTLRGDEIAAPLPVYQTIMDEFKQHSKDPGFKAEYFYKFHPDRQVNQVAIDMIAERYQGAKPENNVQLGELVTRLLFEIKLTVINMQIDDLEAGLKQAQEANDIDRQMALLAHQPELLAMRNELCKILGNRIINL